MCSDCTDPATIWWTATPALDNDCMAGPDCGYWQLSRRADHQCPGGRRALPSIDVHAEIEAARIRCGGACAEDDNRRTCSPELVCRTEVLNGADVAPSCAEMGLQNARISSVRSADDGNVTAGDGCSIAADSSCRAQGDLRPASALTLVPSIGDNVLGFGGGDTTGATADLSGTCATTAASPEHVFDRV